MPTPIRKSNDEMYELFTEADAQLQATGNSLTLACIDMQHEKLLRATAELGVVVQSLGTILGELMLREIDRDQDDSVLE